MTLIEPGTTTELVAGDLQTSALKLTLRWHADRFGHAVDLISAEGSCRIFETAEGAPEDAWPANPPLQQASLETVNGRPAILGVGMAGRSHWSVSIEAFEDENEHATPLLRFDCACRLGEQPARLGSQYRCIGDLVCQQDAFAGTYVQVGPTRVIIVPDAQQSEITTNHDRHGWSAGPESYDADETPTARWSYQICIA